MIYFYQAKMKKGIDKVKIKGATLEMIQDKIKQLEKSGYILIGKIEML